MISTSATESDKEKRRYQHSGIAKKFYSNEAWTWFQDVKIVKICFCSVPDSEDSKVETPQLIKNMNEPERQWRGRVQMVFSMTGNNGMPWKKWDALMKSCAMESVIITEANFKKVGNMKDLSKFFGTLYSDARSVELQQNVMVLGFKDQTQSQPVWKTQVKKEEPVLSPTVAPSVDDVMSFVESIKTQATKSDSSTPISWDQIDQYIAKRLAEEKEKQTPGQGPEVKYKRGAYKKRKLHKAGEFSLSCENSRDVTELRPQCFEFPYKASETEIAWKVDVVSFLQGSGMYDVRSRSTASVLRIMKGLIPDSYLNDPYFMMRKKKNFALLYPHSEKIGDPSWPSTLELHRLSLKMEGEAADLLSKLGTQIQGTGNMEIALSMGAEMTARFQAIWGMAGGLRGGGKEYWSSEPPSTASMPLVIKAAADEMVASLTKLKTLRPSAYKRQILVVDEASWGFRYLAKLVLILVDLHPSAQTLSKFKNTLSDCTVFCNNALMMDRVPLVEYIRGFVSYMSTLNSIAELLGMQLPLPSMELAKLTLQSVKILQVNQVTIDNCKQQEALELTSICKHLRVDQPRAVEMKDSFINTVKALMEEDSHLNNNTAHLSPSPSLQEAKYDPGFYVREPKKKQKAQQTAAERIKTQCRAKQQTKQQHVVDQGVPGSSDNAGVSAKSGAC